MGRVGRDFSANESIEIQKLLQILVLTAMAETNFWRDGIVSFQGGSSLNLVWGSPRFSQDLDFLTSASPASQHEAMTRVIRRASDLLHGFRDGELEYSSKLDAESGLSRFTIKFSKDGFRSKVRLKVEFFTVPGNLLDETRLNFQELPPTTEKYEKLRPVVPASSPEALLIDKYVALVYREPMRLADLFDIWWLRTSGKIVTDLLSPSQTLEMLRNTTGAYGRDLKNFAVTLVSKTIPEVERKTAEDIFAAVRSELPEKFVGLLQSNGVFQQIRTICLRDLRTLTTTLGADRAHGSRCR